MKKAPTPEILATRLLQDVVVRASLEKKLQEGKKLRVKLGMDPTAPDLHLGHAVALRLLKRFQDAGHTIIFIIGDYTARIGDPSGKSKTRPQLDPATIDANAKTYFKQVGKVLDISRAEIRYNSEWLSKLGFEDLIKLAGQFTVARILERDDFAKRLKTSTEISCHELLYPMMQAQDSVAIEADVEVGGTDQTFNMLAGRELQKKLGLPEQDVITVPLLVGLDGEQKMSKSLNNYIGLAESAEDMYGKLMSIPDRLLPQYFALCTNMTDAEVENVGRALLADDVNPRDLKMQLAKMVTALYHDEKVAAVAEQHFVSVFQKKETPEEVTVIHVKKETLVAADLLVEIGLAASKTEARRLIEQKGMKVDGVVITDPHMSLAIGKNGVLIQKGKRHFVRAMQ
ncbi:tyrosine--tRNA ligase [Patescibacteria group bacterium]|nr:tyrosine--tRNA ligase [Patescibacteria group bacterium]